MAEPCLYIDKHATRVGARAARADIEALRPARSMFTWRAYRCADCGWFHVGLMRRRWWHRWSR